MLNPGTILARPHTVALTQEELLSIALVDSPKIIGMKEFRKELNYLGLNGSSYLLKSVTLNDPEDYLLPLVEDYMDGSVVTSQTRATLFEQYQKTMPVKDHLITTWYLTDMWALDTRQFRFAHKALLGSMSNYDAMKVISNQGVPLYKPNRFSWKKFWALCVIEMTASREFFTSLNQQPQDYERELSTVREAA